MELVKVKNENGKQLVSARELYEFLEVSTHFSTWFNRTCEKYGFLDNIDFSILKSGNPNGGIDKIDDYVITLDVAKELAMVSNTAKGKEARQYFIQCEKAWNSPEMILARAMHVANQKVLDYENKIKTLEAPAKLGKALMASEATIKVGDLAKLLVSRGYKKLPNDHKCGPNNLMDYLRMEKYLCLDNKPQQRYIDSGLFEVKENVLSLNGKDKISFTPMLTSKGQEYFLKKFKLL